MGRGRNVYDAGAFLNVGIENSIIKVGKIGTLTAHTAHFLLFLIVVGVTDCYVTKSGPCIYVYDSAETKRTTMRIK